MSARSRVVLRRALLLIVRHLETAPVIDPLVLRRGLLMFVRFTDHQPAPTPLEVVIALAFAGLAGVLKEPDR